MSRIVFMVRAVDIRVLAGFIFIRPGCVVAYGIKIRVILADGRRLGVVVIVNLHR